jgi:RNA polymerase sigma-70 factor (ECF subfamily)
MTELGWGEIFQTHERFLWGLLYRLTGNAADADDLVQETFVRAMKSPPAKADEPWRPWLVRVAVNLGRDLLRRRKRQPYDGIWLPSPILTEDENTAPTYEPVDEQGNPAARYDMLESVSFAFLLALEALTPAQRAVLLLRDVFDYSVRETAEALAMTEANIKTTHSRARRVMQGYEQQRQPAAPVQAQQALQRFLDCLARNDVAGVEALLARNVTALSDGGGQYIAARVPIIGAAKVALLYRHAGKTFDPATVTVEMHWFNGAAAIVFRSSNPPAGYAPCSVTLLEVNTNGQIERIYTVVAPRKLKHI